MTTETPPARGNAVTRRLRAFGAFWYDFVIGDDWVVAAGVVIGLAGTFGLHEAGVTAWWLLPLVLVALLPISLQRAVSGPLLPRRRPGQRTPQASPRTPPAS
jgi:hypothetical protein